MFKKLGVWFEIERSVFETENSRHLLYTIINNKKINFFHTNIGLIRSKGFTKAYTSKVQKSKILIKVLNII